MATLPSDTKDVSEQNEKLGNSTRDGARGSAPATSSSSAETPDIPRMQESSGNITGHDPLRAIQDKRATLVTTYLGTASHDKLPLPLTEDEKLQVALETSRQTISSHIARLKRYNEIKDIAQGLLGMVAERRGVRIAEIMEELGLDHSD